MYGELLPGQAEQELQQQTIEAMRARAAWSRIRYFTPQQRLRAARETRSLRRMEVVRVVLGEAFGASRNEPNLAREWSEFAIQLIGHLPSREMAPREREEQLGGAYTVLGNACRVGGDYQAAATAIQKASNLLDKHRTLLLADLLSIHASLRNDHGDIRSASGLIEEALELYTALKSRHGVARTKVKHANFLRELRPSEAREIAADALLVLPRSEFRLEMYCRCIISQTYAQERDGHRALSHLVEARPLISQFREPWLEGRVQFLEALILDSLDYVADAERLYLEVARLFWFREMYRESFIVRLKLFEFFVGRSRSREATEVVRKTLVLLDEAKVHAQMKELWQDLLAALEARTLDLGVLQVLRDYMVRHWLVPSETPPAIF